MDGDAAIVVSIGRDVIEGVAVQFVVFHEAVTVVDGQRPETVDRHLTHGQGVRYLPVIPRQGLPDIRGRRRWVAAPTRRRSDEVADRVDLFPRTERASRKPSGPGGQSIQQAPHRIQ
jgi:hypothetical protein